MRSHNSLPRRAAWATTVALVLSSALSLILGRLHPFGDAQLFAAPRTQPPQLPASIPAEARMILATDCADCHSAQARAPLYGRFAPVSWLLERDILEARSHLDLSAWDGYSPDWQRMLLAEIEQQAKARQMPPPQYLLVHRDARPKASDVAALVAWAHAASLVEDQREATSAAPLPPQVPMAQHGGEDGTSAKNTEVADRGPAQAATATQALLAPDPARGQDLFNRRCTGCHTLTENREGPHLAGVYGRAAASVAGFPYSNALTTAHLTWNDQTIDRWLTDPDVFVPGVNMDFRVPKAQERADIIAYLKTLSK